MKWNRQAFDDLYEIIEAAAPGGGGVTDEGVNKLMDAVDELQKIKLPEALHVIVETFAAGTTRGKCLHCGATIELNFPMYFDNLIDSCDAFRVLHAPCPKKEEATE